MSHARENRKARRKRDKRFVKRVAEKKIGPTIFRAEGGKNPEYYGMTIFPKTVVRNGERHLLIAKTKYRLRPNRKYRDTMKQLAEMCAGVAVDLGAIVRGEPCSSSSSS